MLAEGNWISGRVRGLVAFHPGMVGWWMWGGVSVCECVCVGGGLGLGPAIASVGRTEIALDGARLSDHRVQQPATSARWTSSGYFMACWVIETPDKAPP